jgi:hypothetical protein
MSCLFFQGQLDLSLLPPDFSLVDGAHVCGRIRKFTDNKQFLLVELPTRQQGRVHVTDLADKYQGIAVVFSVENFVQLPYAGDESWSKA